MSLWSLRSILVFMIFIMRYISKFLPGSEEEPEEKEKDKEKEIAETESALFCLPPF